MFQSAQIGWGLFLAQVMGPFRGSPWQMPIPFRLCVGLWICIANGCLALADDFPQIYNSERNKDLVPLSADDAAASMQLPAGFKATVFAAEPDVRNPIAMTFDHHGRLWVAENFTYAERPLRFDLSLRDRVLILRDTNGDGYADSRQVFTDQVQMLTSVEVGRGGVWLMCPPNLLFIPDADQDGIPDGPAEVVLDGFEVASDNYHNFANGLKWGPDGWLYGRCGHSCPGLLGVPGTPQEQRVPIDGGIWRFHPEHKTVEVLCHGTVNPWGHDWDANGELFFINTVIGHLWHMLPGSHFKESFGESQNPAVYERMDMIADHYHFDTSANWTQSRDGKANDLGGGHAHIGMMIYQGHQWPTSYSGKLMTINMHGRRINLERLERMGCGYVGRHEPDFMISQDPFFRGMDLCHAPDGSVFVSDWSDTGECHEQTGVHRTSGRIYQLRYGDGGSEQRPITKPACLQGPGVLPTLWKDYQAGNCSPQRLRGLLTDADEHVRSWAIRLLTDRWPLDTILGPLPDSQYPDHPETIDALANVAANDSSGLVLLTLASTLQRLPVSERVRIARPLVRQSQHADDRQLPYLVWYGLIPVADAAPDQLIGIIPEIRWPSLLRWSSRYLASKVHRQPELLDAILERMPRVPAELHVELFSAMQDAFRGWSTVPTPNPWAAIVQSELASRFPRQIQELSILFGDGREIAEVRAVALDSEAAIPVRQQALRTLIDARPDDLQAVCEKLLDTRILNGTALIGLSRFDDPQIAKRLVSKYRRFQPSDRPRVLEVLVSRRSFAKILIDALERGDGPVSSSDLTAFHIRQIHDLRDPEISQQITEVWGEIRETSAERQTQMARLRSELQPAHLAAADLSAGRALFDRTCSQCHQLYDNGHPIGPNLTGAQRADLDYLIMHIVDPNAVVGKQYRMSRVLTTDGRLLSGMVTSRDQQVVRMQTQTTQEVLAVDDIDQIELTTLSPMPEGLLDNLTPQQIVDLIAYLMHPTQVARPPSAD